MALFSTSWPAAGVVVLLLAVLPGCSSSSTRPTTESVSELRIVGDVSEPRSWTSASIRERFGDHLELVQHATDEESITLQAVPLATLIEAARPKFDRSRKNPALSFAILVQARDGYSVGFTFDEVVPREGVPADVFLAFSERGGPLPDKFGPARLVIDGAKGRSRRIHAVTQVKVVDLNRR